MRALTKPTDAFQNVFNLCLQGVGPNDLKNRYSGIFPNLDQHATDYDTHALASDLWRIPANHQSNDEIITGAVTKKELKNLYSSYLAVREKPANIIYDKLMSLAPNEMCPYCGMGRVSTLDHYLPKSKFPLHSIVLQNLIPSCRDCNLGSKATAIATEPQEQPIHPYYDAADFNSDQWLYCRVINTSPVTVSFLANPPQTWTAIKRSRVYAHLRSFELSSRFSFQAAEELSLIRQVFLSFYNNLSANDRKLYLTQQETAESQLHVNSWKRAMYQALSNDANYCDGGYR